MDLSAPQIAGTHLAEFDNAYREVNPTQIGLISSQDSVNYLKRTQLTNEKLGKVWELSDYSQRGSLDRRGFFVALKSCALIQKGLEPTVDNLHMDIGLPDMTSSGPLSPAMIPNNNMNSISDDWSIPMDERIKYDAIFESLGPLAGKLPGDKVKPVLLNSGLPMNILGKIWDLSDIDKDGNLDKGEMSVALHLVYRSLENDALPSTLPLHIIPLDKRAARRNSLSQPLMTDSQHSSPNRRLPIGAVQVLPPPTGGGHRSRTASITSVESLGLGMAPLHNISHPPPVVHPQVERRASGNSLGQRSLTGTPLSMLNTVAPPAPWIVNKHKYESAFIAADTNQDGLVSGNDIKQSFLMSGLAQNYLAHIWSLVDMNHTGQLNLEQYALAMHLIEHKKDLNEEPPPQLTPDLIPPSFRPNPAGMTDMATSTQFEAEPIAQECKELSEARNLLEALLLEKRQVDSTVIQLETDSTIKNSEIKNLEIECQTLENTVKQLDRQKAEAGKRLDDLDLQKNSLQTGLNDLLAKIALEEDTINALKDDVDKTQSNAKAQEDELNCKREQLQNLRNEESQMEVQLQMQKAGLDTLAQQHGFTESKINTTDTNMKQLIEQTEIMQSKLNTLEEILTTENVQKLKEQERDLLAPIVKLSLPSVKVDKTPRRMSGYQDNTFSMHNHNTFNDFGQSGASQPTNNGFTAHVDPFKQDDDPFASSNCDPFASNDPFGVTVDPFAGGNQASDPFTNSQAFQSDPFAGPPKPEPVKKAPSRPPPPKSKTPVPLTPTDPFAGVAKDPFNSNVNHNANGDPFGGAKSDPFSQSEQDPFNSAETPASNDGFANFANFANFS